MKHEAHSQIWAGIVKYFTIIRLDLQLLNTNIQNCFHHTVRISGVYSGSENRHNGTEK
jgi:hypothetical protein